MLKLTICRVVIEVMVVWLKYLLSFLPMSDMPDKVKVKYRLWPKVMSLPKSDHQVEHLKGKNVIS